MRRGDGDGSRGWPWQVFCELVYVPNGLTILCGAGGAFSGRSCTCMLFVKQYHSSLSFEYCFARLSIKAIGQTQNFPQICKRHVERSDQ